MKTFNRDLLRKGVMALNIDISEEQIDVFENYCSLIIDWNKKINITSIIDIDDIIKKHFIDSISICKIINDLNNKKIIDIGSGAGFPGLPIKILFNSVDITFVDSSNKRSKILKIICDEIGINNFSVINESIENISRNEIYRENYDICLSRALAPLNVLIEYSLPLLKIKGKLIAYKGPNYSKEVENANNSLTELNGKIIEKAEFELPFTDLKRSIIVVEKLWKTDNKYPRKVGIPRKRPL